MSRENILIVLEGPAGVGKTTLQKHLHRALQKKGIKTKKIPEFSRTRIGKSIKQNSKYGADRPEWLKGKNGFELFMSDKTDSIMKFSKAKIRIGICDRFITSQLILGVKMFNDEKQKRDASNFINQISDSILNEFSKKSLFIFLEAAASTLNDRLERRIKRKLTTIERVGLEEEVNQYKAISGTIDNKIIINTESSIDHTVKCMLDQLVDICLN